MKGVWLTFMCVFMYLAATAQNRIVREPDKVTQMLSTYKATHQGEQEMQGWRIRLVATTERRIMESTRDRFRKEYPDIKTRWTHMNPYYQVQAGAFATKLEALPELSRIKENFPKAYLVLERIPKEEILSSL